MTQTKSGVTVKHIAVFGNVNGDIIDGGASIADLETGVTTITGMVKGNGTVFEEAVADTDYQNPISLTTTGTGAATFVDDVLNIPTASGGTSITSGTWVARPGSPTAQQLYFATDLGTGILIQWTGSKWKPASGSAVLSQSGVNIQTTNTTETNLVAIKIPAGMISTNGKLRMHFDWDLANNSGAGATFNVRLNSTSGAVTGGDFLAQTATAHLNASDDATMAAQNSTTNVWITDYTYASSTGVVTVNFTQTAGNTSLASDAYININAIAPTGGGSAIGINAYTIEWLEG